MCGVQSQLIGYKIFLVDSMEMGYVMLSQFKVAGCLSC